MDTMKFGTKEIVASVAGAFLFAAARVFESYIYEKGTIPMLTGECICLGILVIAVTAVFFGPVCGLVCGIGGDLIIRTLPGNHVSLLELSTLALYGLTLGWYYGKKHYNPDRFGFREFIDFNVIQIALAILCGMFIMPLGTYLAGADVDESVRMGLASTVVTVVMVGVIVPLIMLIVRGVRSSKRKIPDT